MFRWFFWKLKTPKSHSEINLPLASLGMNQSSAYAFFNILCTGVMTWPNFGTLRLLQDPLIDLYLSSLLQIGSAGHSSFSKNLEWIQSTGTKSCPRQDPDVVQGISAFRDFTICDPRYFVILFQASISWIPLHFMILKKKKSKKSKKKSHFFLLFLIFFSKSWNGEEFTKLRPETESPNSGDHELWNHEMRGSPLHI